MPKRIIGKASDAFPNSTVEFKRSKLYTLESLLTSHDYVPIGTKPVGLFNGSDLVYSRSHVTALKSNQVWKSRYSRQVKSSEQPLRVIQKSVGGISKTIQLFSMDQTEPMPNLVASREHGLPTNEFGNIEASAIPEGACLIAVPVDEVALAVRACKSMKQLVWCKCQSGWSRRKPVFNGVVVLEEDKARVERVILEEIEKKNQKEILEKRTATLALWRTLLKRIIAEWYIRTNIEKN